MRQVPYAILRKDEDRGAVLRELRAAGVPEDRVAFIEEPAVIDESEKRELPLRSTRIGRGFLNGLAAGIIGGLVVGVGTWILTGVTGDLGISPWWAGLLGAAVGAFYGALAGLLTGAADPPRELSQAAQRLGDDEVLVVVNLDRRRGPPPRQIRRILQAHGGRA